ncbi:hypothetical protein D3C72_1043110 [compost metagenome]
MAGGMPTPGCFGLAAGSCAAGVSTGGAAAVLTGISAGITNPSCSRAKRSMPALVLESAIS